MNKLIILIIILLLISGGSFSQVYTNKVVGEKNEALKDSIEKEQYPYILPIWGKKVTEKGFQLPYSAGIGVNYLWQESSLIIDDLMVGFNYGTMYNMDELIRFDDATSIAHAVNIRPDIWLFPFLNVYGVLGAAKTSTEINAGLWLPDIDSTWSEVTTFSTKADFDAVIMGFGMTPTLGVAGGWIALDMNVAWSDVSALDKPVFTFVFGPRAGKSFKFKKHPDMNIAGWVGGFRVKFSSETTGSINISELFDTEELQGKVDEGLARVDETAGQVEEWWEGLTPVEQKNPVNIAKYEGANKLIGTAGSVLTSMDGALNDGQDATVQYSLEKSLENMWNFVIGTQFQINRHLMVRVEYGFLGTRQQVITGLQYRFGL
jgi:hypothetical protein